MTLSCLSPELVFLACLRVVLAEILLFRDLLDLNGAFLVNSSYFTVSIMSLSRLGILRIWPRIHENIPMVDDP